MSNPSISRIRMCVMILSLSGVGLVGVGCDSTGGRIHGYRLNPTPEVDTLSQSHDEIENAVTVAYDYNLRSLNQDVGRFWLTDRPSRLSRVEINH